MGMGTSANYVDEVSEQFVKETVPEQFETFMQALKDEGVAIEDFANARQFDSADYGDSIHITYNDLILSFENATGLSLEVGFHEKEDRYDDVDGVFWGVGNVYQLSPSGEKYSSQIERRFYTVFG